MMIQLSLILLALALVLMNAFFVAAEFSMVKLRNTRLQAIKAQHGMRGYILGQIHQQMDAYLSACQLGITLASLGLGWVGEPAFADIMVPFLSSVGIVSKEIIDIVAFIIIFSIISFLHIVIGELMPKSLAIRQAEIISLWTSIPLFCFYWVMYPGIWLLNTCSNFLLKKIGLDKVDGADNFYSNQEIKVILNASHTHGELSIAEKKMLEHMLEFTDLQVTEVMRTAEEMIALTLQDPIEVSLKTMFSQRYSRYPVVDKQTNKVIGIIHMKDVFTAYYDKEMINNLKDYIRPVLKVPHTTLAFDLLRKFRGGTSHFALIYKDREQLLGFVTLDNLLHILLGRIKDEFHKTQNDWIKNADGSLTVQGHCSIYSLERAIGKDITLSAEEQELDTLAGLLIERAGTLPHEGETIAFNEFDAVIEKLHGSQIRQVKIIPK